MAIRTETITVTLTSAAGSADSGHVISGEIKAVHIDYTDIAAGTCDVTVATKSAPAQTILARSNSVTDGWFYPRVALCDTSAAALLYAAGGTGVHGCIPVCDYLTVSVAQADSGSIVVTVLYEE